MSRMARPLNFPEKMLLRFAAGTSARIKALIGESDMASFIREAVDREIRRREKLKPKD